MELFAIFGLLPLALFSFLSKGKRADAGFGFLAALAPVVASAVGGLINRKSQQSAEQRQADYLRQRAEQEEAQRQAAFQAQQSSPQAQMQRLRFNTRLAQLLGGFGGRGQTPGFILNAFDAARTPQEYTPGGGFIEPPKRTGGGFWDYAGDVANAASYFDTSRYSRGGQGAAPGNMDILPQGKDYTSSVFGGQQGQPIASLPSSYRNQRFKGLDPPDVPIWDRR